MTIATDSFIGAVLASLPLAAFLAIVWILRLRREGWRSSALGAAVCWGVFVALIIEVLSIPRLITRPALSIAWLSFTLISLAYGWMIHRSKSPKHEVEEVRQETDAGPLDKMDWAQITGIGLLVALVGTTAILSAPNTWDAMAYHMSRVTQWMTNRDVNLYPAFYSAQLFLSPWAEYAILHLDVLYGGDRLANLIEVLSMIGTVTGVSLIAKQLGASRPGQLLAAVAVATLPEGILEASGAMNTYVGAFWIVVAVYYLLRWNARQCWSIAVALGAAVGLAILTKGTAYVFLPFILVAIWWMGSVPARKSLLARLPVFLIIILALNGPLFVRNWRLSASPLGFSSPLGDDAERQYGNSRISPSIAIANVVKNLSLHVATPIGSVNARTQRVIVGTLRRLGMDPSDKASTYRGGFHLNGFSSHEARAGNPLQLALIGLTGLFLFSGKIGNRNLRLYMFGLAASFVLFCALIRWQPWNSRYHLPLFALGMALVGVVLERRWNQVTLFVVACLMLVSALPFALFNSLRPLAPWPRASVFREARLDSYFADSHDRWIDSYVSATKLVESSHCNSVGVDSSLEDFDYPVFALLNAGHTEREVHYAGVRNLTAAYARSGVQTPCVVICLRCANAPAKWAEYKDVGGRASVFDEVVVFSSAGNVANDQTVDLPEPTDVARILKELDGYRDSPRAVNFATTEARIDRAGKDWPLKRADLKARLNALYTGGLTLWRVRDSVDPMRRKGQPVNNARVDPTQLLAASSVFTNWDQTIDGKVDELNQLVDQLYSSWQTTLVTTPSIADDNSAACRVTVRTMRQTLANPALQTKITQTDERSVERADCSCLRNRVNAGELLARKAFGKYDCEVENRTICDMSSSNPADSQITWAPVGNFKTSDVRH